MLPASRCVAGIRPDARATSHGGGIHASLVDPLFAAGVREVPEKKGDTVSPLSNEAAVRDEP